MNTAEVNVQPRFHRWLDALWGVDPRWLAVSFLLVLTAVSFWGTLDAFFVQDDFRILDAVEHPMPNVGMLRGVFFFRPLPTYWIPLLNVSLWGLQPFWHHAMYFLMFLATVGGLFFWLRGAVKSTAAALAGASLYALSKTHLYTLGWIAGGIDVSAAMFLVFALWATDAYFRRSDAEGGRAGRRMLLVIAIAFTCGLLSKESCIIFAPACAALVAARMLGAKRRFTSAELKLGVVLTIIIAVYLPAWKTTTSVANNMAGQLQFDLSRGQKVLEDSVIAVLPATEMSVPRSMWWMLAGPLMACLAAIPLFPQFHRLRSNSPFKKCDVGVAVVLPPLECREIRGGSTTATPTLACTAGQAGSGTLFQRAAMLDKEHCEPATQPCRDQESAAAKSRLFGYIVLGLSLWVLPAMLFVFTRYPWGLQLYYSHFCIFGLALLAALAVRSLQDRLRVWCFEPRSTPSRRRVTLDWSAIGITTLLFLVWIGSAGTAIRSSVRNHASPALFLAGISKTAFDTLHPYLRNDTYREVVFLDLSEHMWASMYYGKMVTVYYPRVEAACDSRDGFEAPEHIRTTSTTLVVRQTGQNDLTIVR